MFTLDERGEHMLGTVSGVSEGLTGVVLSSPGVHDLLCFLEDLRGHNGPRRTLVIEMILFRNVHLLSGQKIFDLTLVVD